MFLQTPPYLVQRSQNQRESESKNWKRHRAVSKPLDFSEKTQTQVVRSSVLAKTILQGTDRKRREDSVKEWTGLEWNIIPRKAESREE